MNKFWVDSSVPTILPPQVRIPCTPSTLLWFIVKFVLYLSFEKTENKQKEAGLGPVFLKNKQILELSTLIGCFKSRD